MNKYDSGYVLTQALSVVGWLVIVLSVVCGAVVGFNVSNDMGWIGFVIAIVGGFQGLLLIGAGTIGAAILDGSVAQQEILSKQASLNAHNSGKQIESQVENLLRLILGNSHGKPGLAFQEQYMGTSIFKSESGVFITNDTAFEARELARGSVAKGKNSSTSSYDAVEDFAIVGPYKIPRINDLYLINGVTYDSVEKVKIAIALEVAKGYPFQLKKYLV